MNILIGAAISLAALVAFSLAFRLSRSARAAHSRGFDTVAMGLAVVLAAMFFFGIGQLLTGLADARAQVAAVGTWTLTLLAAVSVLGLALSVRLIAGGRRQALAARPVATPPPGPMQAANDNLGAAVRRAA